MPSDSIISGKVVDIEHGKGISNLLIEAWGKSRLTGPRRPGPRYRKQKIAEGTTSSSGAFKIKISGSSLARLSAAKIWFKVISPAGQKLLDSEDSIVWSPDNPQEIKIAVEWDNTSGGTVPSSELTLKSDDGAVRIHLDANGGSGKFGGNTADGELALFPKNVTNIGNMDLATIRMNAQDGGLNLGGNNVSGNLSLYDRAGIGQIFFNALNGSGTFGGKGIDGQVTVYPATATDNTDPTQAAIRLDGETGDILLANADCAEDFNVKSSEFSDIQPGNVMVLDEEAHLSLCRQAYDNRVAGIISGAGDYRPGIVLDKQTSSDHRMPLALMGKVYCWVDADYDGINIGDMLTTSPTLGHAMKVNDREKAFGAVIGKALRSLNAGQGLIPILVALQ